eukprot:9474976-Pyramimonas_sp.AAC.1
MRTRKTHTGSRTSRQEDSGAVLREAGGGTRSQLEATGALLFRAGYWCAARAPGKLGCRKKWDEVGGAEG